MASASKPWMRSVMSPVSQPLVSGLGLGLGDGGRSLDIVVPGGCRAAHDDAVVEHEGLVEARHVDVQRPLTGGHAEERQGAVGGQRSHGRLDERGDTGALEDDVEGAVALDERGQVQLPSGGVAGADALDELAVAIRRGPSRVGGDLETAQPQRQAWPAGRWCPHRSPAHVAAPTGPGVSAPGPPGAVTW